MGFTDKKLEIAIFAFAVVMLGAMGYVLKAPVQAVLSDQEIVYEMPRPKSSILAALFGLGDREISRTYKNPFDKKKAEDAKKAEAAKAAAAAPAKPAVAQKKANAKKADPTKKKVDVQVVGAEVKATFGGDKDMAAGPTGAVAADVVNNQKTTTEQNPQDNKDGLKADQWIALLRAQPTKENIAKLIAAYSKQEVDDRTFYTIVEDLFRSNKADEQALGLAAVKSFYNLNSFAYTAKYADQFAPDLKDDVHEYLYSYGVSSRLTILKAALQDKNSAEVVLTAADVVIDGYQKAKNGTTSPSTDPRNARGDVKTNSVTNYQQFIAVFQELTKSPVPEIQTAANLALSQIQISVAAL